MYNLFIVMTMKRSGHHAFIDWMCSNMDGGTHYNNAVDGWDEKQWGAGGLTGNKKRYITEFGRPRFYDHNIIISIEDFDMDDWTIAKFEEFKQYKEATKVYPILFMRSFKNWLASCIQRKYTDQGKDVCDYLDIRYINDRKMNSISRIHLYSRQLLEFIAPMIPNLTAVSYDKWVSQPQYRKDIARKLLIADSSKSLKDMSPFGGGSSFDGMKYDGTAYDMPVLERYKVLSGDEIFHRLKMKYIHLDKMSHNNLEVLHDQYASTNHE